LIAEKLHRQQGNFHLGGTPAIWQPPVGDYSGFSSDHPAFARIEFWQPAARVSHRP
jgi:hypothetical protein